MLRNYLLISFRNIRENKGSVLLNILCLALGMATCLFIYNYVQFEYSYDNFHRDVDRIRRVETDTYFRQEVIKTNALTKFNTSRQLKERFGEIQETGRLIPFSENGTAFILSQDIDSAKRTTFLEKAYYSENSLLDILSIDWIEAVKATLDKNQVVVSQKVAAQLFPKKFEAGARIIGEKVKIRTSGQNEETWTISGIFEELPNNSHLSFGALFSLESRDYLLNSKSTPNTLTYALVSDQYTRNMYMNDLVDRKTLSEQSFLELDFLSLRPLTDIHTTANISNDPGQSANKTFILFLLVMGSIILILASTNYINSSIISSIGRSKEIGVRKLIGMKPRQLIWHTLIESACINVFSGIIALVIFLVGVRSTALFTNIDYPNILDLSLILRSTIILIVLILFTALISGYYPAKLLVGLKPIEAMKGKVQVVSSKQSNKGSKVMRVLLIFQLTMSIIFISGLFIVQKQLNHVKLKDDKSFRMNLTGKFPGLTGANDYFALQAEGFIKTLINDGTIEYAHVSNLFNGQVKMRQRIKPLYQVGGDTTALVGKFDLYVVDYNYFDGSKHRFLAGSNFRKRFGLDFNGVIVNQAAMKAMRFDMADSAIDKKVRPYNGPLVVKAVIANDSINDIPKVYVTGLRYPTYIDMTIRTRGNSAEKLNAVVSSTRAIWNKQFQGLYFLTRKYEEQNAMEKNLVTLFFFFTIMAIIIASLGIFGLSSFTALKRTKEIGMRKILGANVAQILYILVYDFIRLMIIGSAIAIPLVVYMGRKWLDNYAFRINIHPGLMLGPVAVMSILAIVIIVTQCWKTSIKSPLNALAQD